MKKGNDGKKNNKSQIITIAILVAVIVLMGATYAWLTVTVSGEKDNTVVVGNLELQLTDGEAINIQDASPMEDSQGKVTTPYHFTVKNTGTIPMKYSVKLVDDLLPAGDVRMPISAVKYYLVTDGFNADAGILGDTSDRIIYTGTLNQNQEKEFDLRLWIDYYAGNTAMNTVFAGKISVDAIQADAE